MDGVVMPRRASTSVRRRRERDASSGGGRMTYLLDNDADVLSVVVLVVHPHPLRRSPPPNRHTESHGCGQVVYSSFCAPTRALHLCRARERGVGEGRTYAQQGLEHRIRRHGHASGRRPGGRVCAPFSGRPLRGSLRHLSATDRRGGDDAVGCAQAGGRGARMYATPTAALVAPPRVQPPHRLHLDMRSLVVAQAGSVARRRSGVNGRRSACVPAVCRRAGTRRQKMGDVCAVLSTSWPNAWVRIVMPSASDVLALASGQKAMAFWLWYQGQSQAKMLA
ncbi:hypothetical protein C8R47DRAFT_250340 [Mycena vitilis]|nr:hypothetical protein C8R47DRAFT_250340 [Mycena vitilis]